MNTAICTAYGRQKRKRIQKRNGYAAAVYPFFLKEKDAEYKEVRYEKAGIWFYAAALTGQQ